MDNDEDSVNSNNINEDEKEIMIMDNENKSVNLNNINEKEKEIIIKKNDNNSVKSNIKSENDKEIIIKKNENNSVKSNIKKDNEKEKITKRSDNNIIKLNIKSDIDKKLVIKKNNNNIIKSNNKSDSEKKLIIKKNDNNFIKSNIKNNNENEEEKEDEKEISFNQIKSEEIENKIMSEEEKDVKSFKIESDNKKEKINKIQFPKSNENNLNNIKDKLIRHNRTKTENIKNVKIFLPHMNKKNFFLNEQFTEISLKEENNSRNVPSFQLNYDSPKKEFNSFFKSRNNFYNGKNNMTEMNFDIEKRHLSLFQIQPSNVNRINENKINEINIKIIKVEKHIIDLENKTKKQFEQILTQLKTLINNKKFEEKNNIQKINNTYRNDYFCKTFSNININDNYKKPNKKRPKLYVTKKLSLKMSESERKTITSFHSKYESNKVIVDNNKNNNNNINMLNQMNNVTLINKIEPYLINKFKDK